MTVRALVVRAWQRLTERVRLIIRNKSIRSGDGVCRFRCKIVLGLVQGKTPTELAAGGLCAPSQVYRVAHLFLREGLSGMADKREDNGEHKVDARFESELLKVVAGSPQGHGYLRPTWTQELLVRGLAERTGVAISASRMSRLLKRHKVRLGRPSKVGGRRAHGRVRWLVHRFRSGPQSGSHGHVSSPRLVKRSMRISRTPLS
jgi:transposase